MVLYHPLIGNVLDLLLFGFLKKITTNLEHYRARHDRKKIVKAM